MVKRIVRVRLMTLTCPPTWVHDTVGMAPESKAQVVNIVVDFVVLVVPAVVVSEPAAAHG